MLLGLISRLTDQKGLDLVNTIFPKVIDGNTQVVVLGTGDPRYESAFRHFESENKGVLWDVHHPYRFFDETPETTFQNLGSLVKHVHVKDSLKINGEIKYKMMGYGDVPVMQAMDELKKSGYDGFVSLEWLKRWNHDLQEPGIVFAHYKSYMDFILSQTPAE